MTIEFDCDNCGKQMKVKDQFAGKTGKCPACGGRVTVPSGDYDFLSEDLSRYDEPMNAGHALNKPCPMCGEMIAADSTSCPLCGEELRAPATKPKASRSPSRMQDYSRESRVAVQLFVTGLLSCFSPILSVYGIIFLIQHPYSFPRKTLAVVGTVLHCIWAGLWLLAIVSGSL